MKRKSRYCRDPSVFALYFYLQPSYGGLDLAQEDGIKINYSKSSKVNKLETVGKYIDYYLFCVGFEALGGILRKHEPTCL